MPCIHGAPTAACAHTGTLLFWGRRRAKKAAATPVGLGYLLNSQPVLAASMHAFNKPHLWLHSLAQWNGCGKHGQPLIPWRHAHMMTLDAPARQGSPIHMHALQASTQQP